MLIVWHCAEVKRFLILKKMILQILAGLLLFHYLLKLTTRRSNTKVCLVGKTAIITGANSGIGLQVALDLASRGCRIIIADKEDATRAKQRIIKETHNDSIVVKHLDLASFANIRNFAEDIINTEDKIDILINNAGIGGAPVTFTEDGIQVTMQINHYGPLLLTHLLLDLMKKSAPSRIVFTASCMAFVSNMTIKDMKIGPDFKDFYGISSHIYSSSKLCVLICANMLAEKLKGTNVTCNSIHPGYVRTPIFLEGFKKDKSIRCLGAEVLSWIYAKSVEDGSQTTIHAAISNEAENISGEHFWECRPFYIPSKAKNKEFCKQVWDESMDMIGLKEYWST